MASPGRAYRRRQGQQRARARAEQRRTAAVESARAAERDRQHAAGLRARALQAARERSAAHEAAGRRQRAAVDRIRETRRAEARATRQAEIRDAERSATRSVVRHRAHATEQAATRRSLTRLQARAIEQAAARHSLSRQRARTAEQAATRSIARQQASATGQAVTRRSLARATERRKLRQSADNRPPVPRETPGPPAAGRARQRARSSRQARAGRRATAGRLAAAARQGAVTGRQARAESSARGQVRTAASRQNALAARRHGARRTAQLKGRREELRRAARQTAVAARGTARQNRQGTRAVTANPGRRRRPAGQLSAGLRRLRCVGPLLLDEHDRPARLRGVQIPGFDTAVPDGEGRYPAAATAAELATLADWGATLLVVPVALDLVLDTSADPPEPREAYLRALDETIGAAARGGLYVLVQLARFAATEVDAEIPIEWPRAMWSALGARYRGEPAVLYDLLRAPAALALYEQVAAPGDPRAVTVHNHLLLGMLSGLRQEHPASVAVSEALAGTVDGLPLTYTDGSLAPDVVVGWRQRTEGDVPVVLPAALGHLARTVPVLALGVGAGPLGASSAEAAGRRLASAGLHWVAEGWPPDGTLAPAGTEPDVAATAAGRSIRRAIAEPQLATGRPPSRPDIPAPLPRGGPGLLGLAARELADLVLAATPAAAPRQLPAVIKPRAGAAAFLPAPAALKRELTRLSRPDRAARIEAWRTVVQAEYDAAAAAGRLALLARVGPAETAQASSRVQPIPGLPGNAPGVYRYRLDLDALDGTAVGRDILKGVMTVAAAARGPQLAMQAIVGLRLAHDVLLRIRIAQQTVAATGATLAEVLALYRTEGDLGVPPSQASLDAGVPPATFKEGSSIGPTAVPDFSTGVWLADPAAFAGVMDSAGALDVALAEYFLQLAGLDDAARTAAAARSRFIDAYQGWTYRVWKDARVDNIGLALRRWLDVKAAGLLRTLSDSSGRNLAWAVDILDPALFAGIVAGDGVQLLRGRLSDVSLLLGSGPNPAGTATTLPPSMRYLVYNLSQQKARLALFSGLVAASRTRRRRWAALRRALAAQPGLVPRIQALAPRLSHLRDDAAVTAADRDLWLVVQPWLRQPGRLELLADWLEHAGAGDWTGWQTPRGNVSRYLLLLDYYGRLQA